MPSINKVLLVGHLTAEPELRYLSGSNNAVCEFTLAMSRKSIDKNNHKKEEVCFVEIVVWGKQAENCQRFLQKGSCVLVEGRLILDKWQDRTTGKMRQRLRVSGERVQFIGGNRQIAENESAPIQEPQPQYQTHPGISGGVPNYGGHKYPKDDVPDYYPPPPDSGTPLDDMEDLAF
jgi:single-strand DNA-binding protein